MPCLQVGGRFVGSVAVPPSRQQSSRGSSAAYVNVTLATITRRPLPQSWNRLALNLSLGLFGPGGAPKIERVTYVAPDGSYGNMAEIRLYSYAPCPRAEQTAAGLARGGVPGECAHLAHRAQELCPAVGLARQCVYGQALDCELLGP